MDITGQYKVYLRVSDGAAIRTRVSDGAAIRTRRPDGRRPLSSHVEKSFYDFNHPR
jgi:hypothetical protein